MKLKPRPQYLSKLVAAQDNSLIKVITGMRRCGKSSLLTLFRQHLLQQGIAEDHIIMMNLESFQYSSFTFEDLHNAIADRMQQDDHYYLLLDEVQLVDKWERAVNALHTDADVDITITGSNAYLLSSQLATLLSGRYRRGDRCIVIFFGALLGWVWHACCDHIALCAAPRPFIYQVHGRRRERHEADAAGQHHPGACVDALGHMP